MTHDNLFPTDFLWGAATSAYQVEGSPLADGAGASIWHRFSHTPGLVANGENGDVACDHYHRYEADVALMRELGLNSYRFSVSWSRVFPEGKGRVNEKGLDFYRRLVDALRAADIQPLITLFHWDLPAALDDRGGWLNHNIARWFADYAAVMYRALDDRRGSSRTADTFTALLRPATATGLRRRSPRTTCCARTAPLSPRIARSERDASASSSTSSRNIPHPKASRTRTPSSAPTRT
jgi:hypothetical protein